MLASPASFRSGMGEAFFFPDCVVSSQGEIAGGDELDVDEIFHVEELRHVSFIFEVIRRSGHTLKIRMMSSSGKRSMLF